MLPSQAIFKRILLTGMTLLVCALACGVPLYLCSELCILTHDGAERTDFRRFVSEADLQDYINQKVSVGESSLNDVRSFIEQEEIVGCNEAEATIDKSKIYSSSQADASWRIRCTVLAPKYNFKPEGGWLGGQALKLLHAFYYEVYLFFCEEVLCEVKVWRQPQSPF